MDLHGSSGPYATRRVSVALLRNCDELRPGMSRSNAFFDAHVNHDLRSSVVFPISLILPPIGPQHPLKQHNSPAILPDVCFKHLQITLVRFCMS